VSRLRLGEWPNVRHGVASVTSGAALLRKCLKEPHN
jgi:hypothetical protein